MAYKKILLFALILSVVSAVSFGQNSANNSQAFGNVTLGGIGTAVVLSTITVSPPTASIPYTQAQAFTAQGTYSNGSQSDITALATWTSSNTSVATNLGACTNPGCGTFQCVARGTVTVTATYQSVSGNGSLTCQSPTFTPQGTINVNQGSSSVTVTQFTAANGSPNYTFSSSDLPGWLSLTNTGCPGTQIDCSLVGTPSTVGVSNFHIQATDSLSDTACSAPGCPVSVNVVTASAEDNTYCTLVGSTETVIGLSMDGPAHPLLNCNYTAISWTTLGGSPTVIMVCPIGQLSSGSSVAGCAGAPQPPLYGCTVGTPVYCATLQAALNYVSSTSGCGSDIEIYPTHDDAVPTSAQNAFYELNPLAPTNINCGPDFGQPWWYIRTKQFANLPPPGNRISPAWVNQSSIVGRPNYSQTSQFGVAAGTYMPLLGCEVTSGGLCQSLTSQMLSATGQVTTNGTTTVVWKSGSKFTTGSVWAGLNIFINSVTYQIASVTDATHLITTIAVPTSPGNGYQYQVESGSILNGLRVMGIMFAAPHGRNTAVDLAGNNLCPPNPNGTPECSPGYGGSIVNIGCNVNGGAGGNLLLNCNSAATGSPDGTGSQHVILDRVLISGCDDITMATCFDSAESLVNLQDGLHMSLIDSYLIDGFCMYAVGPCVESHGVSGGNVQESVNDTGIKIVDNYIEASGENTFFGGGTSNSGIYPTDIEMRRNHFFKPLTWKPDDPSFPGLVQGAFQQGSATAIGSGYDGSTTCSIAPPISGTTATCTPIVVGGSIVDVQITGAGSGYGLSTKQNGNTYAAYPQIIFTDGGFSYAACSTQLSGFVNAVNDGDGIHSDITWVADQKFVSGMVGTQLTLPTGNYSINSFTPGKVPLLQVVGLTGTQTDVAYSSNLATNPIGGAPSACYKVLLGMPDVKNIGELKHALRVLIEGNIFENCWVGTSDQQGFCYLITPKNPNNNCPTCQVQDVTYRYNFCRKTTHGMQIAAAAATQGGTLSLYLQNISVHDSIWDSMNGVYLTAGTSPISSGSGTLFDVENVQAQPYATANIQMNHNTGIATLPTGYSLSAGACMALFFNVKGATPAMMEGITLENTICAGGVKQSGSNNSGNINCLNNACTDQAGHGPTETALRQVLTNDFDHPITGGFYAGNQVTSLVITEGGTCTGLPSTVTVSGGGGAGATGKFNTGAGTSHNAIIKLWPVFAGAGYTSAPSVTFGGAGMTCSVIPTATAYIAGAGNPSGSAACFDHLVMPLAAWNGMITMSPYPTPQIDATNSCASSSGGHINTNVAGSPITVNTWADLDFQNFLTDGNGAEVPTGDLHLRYDGSCPGSGICSPFHAAGNDGLDLGANVDLVLGSESGTPSPYTGISISGGVAVLPQ